MRRQPGGNASLTLFPCPSAGLSSDSSPCCSMLSHERRRPPKYAPEYAPQPVVGLEADVAARPGPAAADVVEARRPHGGCPRNAGRRPAAARDRGPRGRAPARGRHGGAGRAGGFCGMDRRPATNPHLRPRGAAAARIGARLYGPTAHRGRRARGRAGLRHPRPRRVVAAPADPPDRRRRAAAAAVRRDRLAGCRRGIFGRARRSRLSHADALRPLRDRRRRADRRGGVPRSLPWLSPRDGSAGVHDVGIGLRRAGPADDARGSGLPSRSARPRVGRRRPGDDRLLRRQRAAPQPGLRRRRSGAGRDACRLAGRQTCHTPEDFAASLRICCGVSRTLN